MKIKTKEFVQFLTELKMDIEEKVLLEFMDYGLDIYNPSLAGTHTAFGMIDKNSELFEEYQPIGSIGIKNFNIFLRIIKSFKKDNPDIEMSVEGNLFIIKGKKKEIFIPIMETKFFFQSEQEQQHKSIFSKALRNPQDLKSKTSYIIKNSDCLDILGDVDMVSDDTFIFETVDNGIMVKNSSEYKVKFYLDSPNTKGGHKIKVGEPFRLAIKNIKNDQILITQTDNDFMMIETKTDGYIIRYMIAPRTDEE